MKWRDAQRTYSDRLAKLRELLRNDPYAVLDIQVTASDDEVKQAYRKYAITYHPDKQDEFFRLHGQEVTKIINAAYERIRVMRES